MTCHKIASALTTTALVFSCMPAFAPQANAESPQTPIQPTTQETIHIDGEVDIIALSDVTAETLKSYGADPSAADGSADEIAEAIDANPVLEADVSEDGDIEVYHPFENRSLVVDAASEIPESAVSSKYSSKLDSYIVEFADEESAAAAYEEITGKDGIDAAFPDVTVKPCAVNYSSYDGWGLSDMNLSTAEYKLDSAASKLKSEVTMAIIDTGLFSSHEVFTNTTVLSSSGSIINARKAALTALSFADTDGHGTHVAGIAAQGTPSSVKLLDIKCYNDGTEGARLSDVYYSLLYAKEKGARVFNISLGAKLGTGKSAASSISCGDYYLKQVYDAGGLIFVAAGNISSNISAVNMYPAVSDYAYAVGALDRSGELASYSNYGPDIDFVAPGSSILSSYNTSKTATKSMSGTSMASPHVAACAADLMIMYPSLSGQEILEKLKGICVDLGSKGKDSTFGYGKPVMNISAIDSAIQAASASATPAVKIDGKIKPESVLYSGIAKSYKYTGKYICPRPTLKAKVAGVKYPLTYYKDYMLLYYNNKNTGTAKMTIKLMGTYTGTYSLQYKIRK